MKPSTVRPRPPGLWKKRRQPGRAQKPTWRSKVRVGPQWAGWWCTSFLRSWTALLRWRGRGSGPWAVRPAGEWLQPGAALCPSSSRLARWWQLQQPCARGLPAEQSGHISLLEAKPIHERGFLVFSMFPHVIFASVPGGSHHHPPFKEEETEAYGDCVSCPRPRRAANVRQSPVHPPCRSALYCGGPRSVCGPSCILVTSLSTHIRVLGSPT